MAGRRRPCWTVTVAAAVGKIASGNSAVEDTVIEATAVGDAAVGNAAAGNTAAGSTAVAGIIAQPIAAHARESLPSPLTSGHHIMTPEPGHSL
jgi:hypothetical protein